MCSVRKNKKFSLLLIRGHIQSTMAVDDDSFQLLGDDGRGANDIGGHLSLTHSYDFNIQVRIQG